MTAPRENVRTRTTYVIEARCEDCDRAESWTIDDVEPEDWDDAFDNVGQDVRHWLGDHHENEHS